MAIDRTFFRSANIDNTIKLVMAKLADLLDTNTYTVAGTIFSGLNTYLGVTSITAFATGGQTNAVALTGEYNEVTVCATAGDSVLLPVAALGKNVVVMNNGVAAVDIFPQVGSSIGNIGINAAYRLGPSQTVLFYADAATVWNYDRESSSKAANNVTQITSAATGVTLNSPKGIITTFSQSAAAGVSAAFTVTCSAAVPTSNIKAYIIGYAGIFTTNGIPVVAVSSRGAGSFGLTVSNAHGVNALSGALTIGFEITA